MNLTIAAATLAATAALTASCSPSDDHTEVATPPPAAPAAAHPAGTPTPAGQATTPARTAGQYATALRAAMKPRAKRTYVMTPKTDSNRILGTPNGYTSAAVIADQAAPACTSALNGIDCGIVVEVWPTAQAAADRVTYVQGILKRAPGLGSEFDYPAGAALLRINGQVVDGKAAKVYEAAWRKIAST